MVICGWLKNTDLSSAESMTDVEVQGELQLENSPIGQHGVPLQEDTGGGGGGKEPDCRESLQNSTQTGQCIDILSYLVTRTDI